MVTMNNRSVDVDVINMLIHVSVSCPVICVHVCSRVNAPCYDGMQSGHIPSVDHLKVSSCWSKFCRDYAKNPRISVRSSSSVVLKDAMLSVFTVDFI